MAPRCLCQLEAEARWRGTDNRVRLSVQAQSGRGRIGHISQMLAPESFVTIATRGPPLEALRPRIDAHATETRKDVEEALRHRRHTDSDGQRASDDRRERPAMLSHRLELAGAARGSSKFGSENGPGPRLVQLPELDELLGTGIRQQSQHHSVNDRV